MKRLSESVKFRIGRQYGNPSIPIGKPFNDLMPGDFFNYIALLCSAIVAFLGILVMAGWVTGIHSLASLGSGSIPQAPASALAFILLGGTWFFYLHKPSRRLARMGVLASALFVLFVALLNLIRFFTGVNAIIEELLISKILVLDPGIYGADPMSPITAASFFLSCVAMTLPLTHVHRKAGLSGGLASIVTLVNLVVLLGYLYGTPLLYGGEIRPVSLPTGISFVFLSAGLIATAGPGHFPLRLLVSPSMRALLETFYYFLGISDFLLTIYHIKILI